MPTIEEKIKAVARKLINDGWTQGTYARDKYGHPVSLCDPSAVSFCLSGALRKATLAEREKTHDFAGVSMFFSDFAADFEHKYGMYMTDFNDKCCRIKDDILEALA